MPIHLREPWREQYFRDVPDPSDVDIPTDDREAFNRNPRHRWIYNRLLIAQSQGLECGPHDVKPARFPVFCSAVTSLDGGECGGRLLWDQRDLVENCGAGHFWMQPLTGERLSTDVAVIAGEVAWCRHALGIWGSTGLLDYWVVEERTRPRLERYCTAWIRRNLDGYTGMVNVETIGGRLSAAHLRFSGQWPDLYGRKWLAAMVRLHQHGTWDLIDSERAEGYSLILTGIHGLVCAYPDADSLRAYEATVGVSSIHLPFFDEASTAARAMPSDAVRPAVINCFNLAVGMGVRSAMAREFGWSAESYRRRTS